MLSQRTKMVLNLVLFGLLLLWVVSCVAVMPAGAQEPDPTPTSMIDDGYGAPGRLFDIDIVLAFAQAILDFIGVNNLRDWVALAAGVAITYAILAKGKTET